jgi:hypothetical protein
LANRAWKNRTFPYAFANFSLRHTRDTLGVSAKLVLFFFSVSTDSNEGDAGAHKNTAHKSFSLGGMMD